MTKSGFVRYFCSTCYKRFACLTMEINKLLNIAVEKEASDLYLTVGAPPTLRVFNKLEPVSGTGPLDSKEVKEVIFSVLDEEQREILKLNKELDFSFSFGQLARVRGNAFHQRGYLAASLRLISMEIPTIDELNLPEICYRFAQLPQGFVLVTGPAGHGKSSTIAAIIDEITKSRSVHIVTIEDPIEYVFPNRSSIINQRELHLDTHSWNAALRSCLRETPDVVFIGEMRDYETISSAITIAETGHLVFSTLHTNSAAQTVDRIIDVFPEHAKSQAQVQLAGILEGILSQRLLPAVDGGLRPAVEVLLATRAVRSTIREGKTHQIDNIISTSLDVGMIPLEKSLAQLVRSNLVSEDVALRNTTHPDQLSRYLSGR